MNTPVSVIISGCHSGPNPSPGLGVGRSLRAAFPQAHLIGRDFSAASTGLHADVFDEAWVCPPWSDVDLAVAQSQLIARLESGWMISGLDSEVQWLAGLEHPRILCPSPSALSAVSKPLFAAAADLAVNIPPTLQLDAGEREVHALCRRSNWAVWVKGPVHEAHLVGSWPELRARVTELESTWGISGLFVQAHITGRESSVAFAALRGELLGAVWLDKRGLTPEGKVWAGHIRAVPDRFESDLRRVVQELNWTGGGELEFIEDASGQRWLFDWNPRFPAWIHAATLAGLNLPGLLVEKAAGESTAVDDSSLSPSFVRVVMEIPAHPELPLPEARAWDAPAGGAGKHPSGMPQLVRRLVRGSNDDHANTSAELPEALEMDLVHVAAALRDTPVRVVLPRVAEVSFRQAARIQDQLGVRVAYSVKTNPDATIMDLAWRHGLMAETISVREIDWALACGWSTSDIVYNGPVPLSRPAGDGRPLGAAFADDVGTFRGYLQGDCARVVGMRLCPPLMSSRFGVRVDDPDEFAAAAIAIASMPTSQPLGMSFHLASSEVGLDHWQQAAKSVMDAARELGRLGNHAIAVLNLGGGWSPDDFGAFAEGTLPQLVLEARVQFGEQVQVIIEPGKALAETAMALFTRVVHIRARSDGARDVILDAGISDVPQIAFFPHRLVHIRGDRVAQLAVGADRVFGPSCRENDCVGQDAALPADLQIGEVLAVCDCGAYDASMSFRFGQGGAREERVSTPPADQVRSS